MAVSKIKHIALDFDNTLAYFENGLNGMFQIFSELSIPDDIIRESYQETKKDGGFNLGKFLNKINLNTGATMKEHEVIDKFQNWLKSSLKSYPDVNDFLIKAAISGIPFSIITVGDESFQKLKIETLGLKPAGLYVVKNVGDKPEILQKMLGNGICPIVYIDDKFSELDAIRKNFSKDDVTTIKIYRPDSPYNDQEPKYEHRVISSLNELDFL